MNELPHLKRARDVIASRILPAYPYGSEVYKAGDEALKRLDDVTEALTGDRQALRAQGMQMPKP